MFAFCSQAFDLLPRLTPPTFLHTCVCEIEGTHSLCVVVDCVLFIFWRARISRILVPSSIQSSSSSGGGAQMQNATQKDVNNHVDRFSRSTAQRPFDIQIRPFAQMHCGECYSKESCYRIPRMIMSIRNAFCVREELFSNHMMARRTSNYLQWQMCRCDAKWNVIDLGVKTIFTLHSTFATLECCIADLSTLRA